jgi:Fe2+ or Zn2+ uptake regulation protein
MQHLNERHYRATRARIHIFRAVLESLEAYPDDDLSETLRRDRVESVRNQLHELESELVSSVAGTPRLPPAPTRFRPDVATRA